jgi:hypothetical protein
MAGKRFSKGDRVAVRSKATGALLDVGTALQDRDFFGLSMFQVDSSERGSEWVTITDYNLNFVDVEVVG